MSSRSWAQRGVKASVNIEPRRAYNETAIRVWSKNVHFECFHLITYSGFRNKQQFYLLNVNRHTRRTWESCASRERWRLRYAYWWKKWIELTFTIDCCLKKNALNSLPLINFTGVAVFISSETDRCETFGIVPFLRCVISTGSMAVGNIRWRLILLLFSTDVLRLTVVFGDMRRLRPLDWPKKKMN